MKLFLGVLLCFVFSHSTFGQNIRTKVGFGLGCMATFNTLLDHNVPSNVDILPNIGMPVHVIFRREVGEGWFWGVQLGVRPKGMHLKVPSDTSYVMISAKQEQYSRVSLTTYAHHAAFTLGKSISLLKIKNLQLQYGGGVDIFRGTSIVGKGGTSNPKPDGFGAVLYAQRCSGVNLHFVAIICNQKRSKNGTASIVYSQGLWQNKQLGYIVNWDLHETYRIASRFSYFVVNFNWYLPKLNIKKYVKS